MSNIDRFPPARPPSWEAKIAMWIVVIAAIWLIGACISATSGTPVSCDSQNVATAGCVNP